MIAAQKETVGLNTGGGDTSRWFPCGATLSAPNPSGGLDRQEAIHPRAKTGDGAGHATNYDVLICWPF